MQESAKIIEILQALKDSTGFREPPVPEDVHEAFADMFIGLRRLKNEGYNPDFIIDVGASSGGWSHYASMLFPAARFILVEPLWSRYSEHWGGVEAYAYTDLHPEFEVVEKAVSNEPGLMALNVSKDLFTSSKLRLPDFLYAETIDVPATTLDILAQEKAVDGRGLLKLDIQFTEHLALEGARRFLRQVDAVVLEMTMVRFLEGKTFLEMLNMMYELGFRYYDDLGGYRLPVNGVLLQKDVLFLRNELFPIFPG